MFANLSSKVISFLVVCVILVILIGQFWQVNSPTQISVVTNLGKVSSIQGSGLFFKIPFISKISTYDTTVQSVECIDNKGKDNCKTLDGGTRDLQSVKVAVQMSYRLDGSKVGELFNLVQDQKTFSDIIVPSTVEEALKIATAKFTSEELVANRSEVKRVLEEELQTRLDKFYLKIVAVNIVNFEFSPAFQAEIEKKVATAQQVLQKEQELKRVEAENKIRLSQAQTEALVKQTNAEGEAKAIAINGEAIRKNPEALEIEKIKKWDGKLPQVQGSGTPIINLEKK